MLWRMTSPTVLARPRSQSYEVQDLVAQAWDGRVRVPTFQRGIVWDRRDVLRLFESVVRGFPVGNLLFWVRPAPAAEVVLGSLRFHADEHEQAAFVVDGQQRLTSLACALHPDASRLDPRFDIAYDLDAEVFVASRDVQPDHVVRLPDLFDSVRLLEYLHDHDLEREQVRHAQAVNAALRQYAVPTYEVRSDDESLLREIFDRMNGYGKPLKRAEVFDALFPSEHDQDDKIGRLAADLQRDTGFGLVDNQTLLYVILARRGPDITRDIHLEFRDDAGRREFPGEGRDGAYRGGYDALLAAVRFLQSEAGVPHVSLLTYRYLLVVLARFFAHHEADVRTTQLLRRWYWRASLYGPELFKGSASGAMRLLCTRIDPVSRSDSLTSLLGAVQRSYRPPMPTLERFRTNEAATRVVLCSWWSRGLLLPDGDPLEIAHLSAVLAEATSAADVARRLYPPSALAEDVRLWAANRVLLPDDDVRDPLDALRAASEGVRRSHLVPSAPPATDDAQDWLETRQAVLREHLHEFVDRQCEWEQEDTLSLQDLLLVDG